MSEFKVGDIVKIRPEFAKTPSHRTSTYEVVKVNPRTLGCKNTATGAKLNADPEVLMLASEATEGATVTLLAPEEIPLPLDKGTVVRPNADGRRRKLPDGLYVITGETSKGYQIFPLGGSTRYYTGVAAKSLDVVPVEEIGKVLQEVAS